MLKQMIADHEPAYADQWRALPESYAHGMLNGIVAFELKILDLQTKVKINQHRPESHAAMHAAYAQGGEQEQALAQWMQTNANSGSLVRYLQGFALTVEAMASDRPYRPKIGIEAGLEEISNKSGVLFDPIVVKACLTLFRERSYKLPEVAGGTNTAKNQVRG